MKENKKILYSSKKIIVKKSNIHGLGVIAKKKIKKGEVVFLVKGEKKFWKAKNVKDSLYGKNWIGIGEDLWIDPYIGHGRYVNHSCDPTASVVGKVTAIALKDLKPGEEITIDYSLVEGSPMWYMRCNCGNNNCRKIIRSVNFLPSKIFKKYKKFMPQYFRKLYIKNHKSD